MSVEHTIEPRYDLLNNQLRIGDTVIVKISIGKTGSFLAFGKVIRFTRLKVEVSYTYQTIENHTINNKAVKYGSDMIRIKSYLIPTKNSTLLDMQTKINERVDNIIENDEELTRLIELYNNLNVILDGH